jgi:hypothetical protein
LSALRVVAICLSLALALYASSATANGRMPGATALSLADPDSRHILVRATFGFVQSFDGGSTWQWVCENAIQVSGESDPPTTVTADGTLVLLPPVGGALISRDHGCSWLKAASPLSGKRSIDLTLDPQNAARVLVVTSTVSKIDESGLVTYDNLLIETRDNAANFTELSQLPGDFRAETLEIAPSDPARIYVSGTASDSPLLGVLFCSENGGQTWTRRTLPLPEGSGSLFISGIHPTDPDRVWVRVPARGDSFGLYPASLLVTKDKGEHFQVLADTQKAMFGFALSPDGAELAYGGPFDGLYVGASDGSSSFTKVNGIGVRCLKWTRAGLYACGSEPPDAFSIGRSTDRGKSFEALYRMTQTCPQECNNLTGFATACRGPWQTIARAIDAGSAQCREQWLTADAGTEAGSNDAGNDSGDAPDAASESGCSCRIGSPLRAPSGLAVLILGLLIAWQRRPGRSKPPLRTAKSGSVGNLSPTNPQSELNKCFEPAP